MSILPPEDLKDGQSSASLLRVRAAEQRSQRGASAGADRRPQRLTGFHDRRPCAMPISSVSCSFGPHQGEPWTHRPRRWVYHRSRRLVNTSVARMFDIFQSKDNNDMASDATVFYCGVCAN